MESNPSIGPPYRIVVIGTSGSGKTTLAANLSSILNIPHCELDQIHWAPNWTEVDDTIFIYEVQKIVQQDNWVIDGNYSNARNVIWPKANLIIWLNYSFYITFRRVFSRSIDRIINKRRLFGNNKETFKQTFLSKDSILLWTLQTYSQRRIRYPRLFQEKKYSTIPKLIFKHPSECQSFLNSL